ncbi:MFS transporter [Actinacidiphila acididurans]|uniref:MFS transporter n=1 Tax=Actinacidiphila acididurans TaxID=2784346 RepID=A0ABS2TZI6_9ACTN|nr:MFS transporter [Actinacidiphila acididurans]MBM9508482.1 MFS transporter [Actinacidiphila acididurans]
MSAPTAVRFSSGYHRMIGAASASAVGDGMRFAALPLLSAALLHGAFRVSAVTAATTVPWLLFGLPAGAYADRFERGRLMVIADLLRALTLIVTVVLLACGGLTFWPLLAAAFLLGVGEVLFDCASFALLPSVVPKDKLETANGRLFRAQTVGRDLLGHVLGGVLFTVGRAIPLLLDALSFLMSAALLTGVRGPRPERSADRPRLLADIREGLDHVLRDPLLRAMTVSAGVINAVYLGQIAVFVLLVRDVLKLPNAAYGALLAAGAVGGVVGSMAASRMTAATGRIPTLVGNLALMGVGDLAVAATKSVYVVAVGYFAAGFGLMVWNIVAVSLRQELIPDRLLGRTTGVYRLFAWGTMPLGALLFGWLSTMGGPQTAFAAGGAVTLAMCPPIALTMLRDSRLKGSRITDDRKTPEGAR